jgi:hypothetical protein
MSRAQQQQLEKLEKMKMHKFWRTSCSSCFLSIALTRWHSFASISAALRNACMSFSHLKTVTNLKQTR